MAFPTPLPTPPNSNKAAFEHSFSDDGHDPGASDSPLFAAARMERCASPTDAVLFPQRPNRSAPASPASPPNLSASPKRRRLDLDDGRHSASLHPSATSRAPLANAPMQYTPLRPIEPQTHILPAIHPERRLPHPSEDERYLVASFQEQMASRFVDYDQEDWWVSFKLKRDPVSKTWLQPLEQPKPRMFAPISSNVQPKRRSNAGVVKSVEASHTSPATPKREALTARAPRHRSSTTPTANAKSETRSTRNPANKPLASKNYRDWPDYSPSAKDMHPDAIKFAKSITQMSGSKDLSNDPLRHELSEAELIAAHRAGMDCARYLCTKRSVFVGYVKHLRYHAGKFELSQEDMKKGLRSWNKTAAQGCSGIDVNKTSALWQHFWQPIGWFNKDLFKDVIEADEIYFPKFDKDGSVVPQYNKSGNLMS